MNLDKWKHWTRQLKLETYALYLACRDPRLPWYARLVAVGVVAYAFSPIDLIPDPIPILGYLDDLILIPLGVILALRLIPPPIMAECRAKARATLDQNQPVGWVAAGIIIVLWLGLVVLLIRLISNLVR